MTEVGVRVMRHKLSGIGLVTAETGVIVAKSTSVLVVEDEPFSRFHAVNLVENAGFIAIEAANADEAIAILESRKDIRIVFTDIDMPGSMDGLKLARAVRERWPPIELILTSGHFDLRQDEIPERGRFFQNPTATQISSPLCGRLLPKRPGEGCYMPWLSL